MWLHEVLTIILHQYLGLMGLVLLLRVLKYGDRAIINVAHVVETLLEVVYGVNSEA